MNKYFYFQWVENHLNKCELLPNFLKILLGFFLPRQKILKNPKTALTKKSPMKSAPNLLYLFN